MMDIEHYIKDMLQQRDKQKVLPQYGCFVGVCNNQSL